MGIIFDKLLDKKITRKEFLKLGSLVILGGLIGGFFKIFTSKKKENGAYGNNAYGGMKP